MKYIKLLENFREREKTRSKAQDVAHQLIVFANQIFKDPSGWKEFLINSSAAWIKPDTCQIEFRYKGSAALYFDMRLAQGQVLGTEFILVKIYWGPKTIGIEDLMTPFYDYLNFLFGENVAYEAKDLDPIIAKLNFDDYELWKDAGKYNL